MKKSSLGKPAKNVKPARVLPVKKGTEAPVAGTEGEAPEIKGARRGAKTPATLRGMKDILPKEEVYWTLMRRTAENLARAYGYNYIETPIVEEAGLFLRTLGKGTDVVDKEMYIFEGDEGAKICLRPEPTASIARAFIIHGMHSWPQPVKVWTMGPMFRHDRPQAGRYRQFHQFGCEVLGERDPSIDAELIVMAYNYLRDLHIPVQVAMNSIGNLEDRERYIVELVGYLRGKRSYLSEESKKRLHRNPLRVLDSKEEQDRVVVEEAPQIIDWLSDASRQYFMKVLEYLDELEVPYVLQPTLVRGLDYYSDTVFELLADVPAEDPHAGLALGGGGRYDGLVEQLGGRPTPGAGFGIGLERTMLFLKRQAEQDPARFHDSVSPLFFAQLGEQARRRALYLIEQLRRVGIVVYHNVAKSSLKAQLELAHKYGVSHALILGQKEVQDGTIIIRDMDSGIQEIIDEKKVEVEVRKLLAKDRG